MNNLIITILFIGSMSGAVNRSDNEPKNHLSFDIVDQITCNDTSQCVVNCNSAPECFEHCDFSCITNKNTANIRCSKITDFGTNPYCSDGLSELTK